MFLLRLPAAGALLDYSPLIAGLATESGFGTSALGFGFKRRGRPRGSGPGHRREHGPGSNVDTGSVVCYRSTLGFLLATAGPRPMMSKLSPRRRSSC